MDEAYSATRRNLDINMRGTTTNLSHSTPAAAAMRSTLRRLREIAEV